jgi:hypothetical protein
MKPRRVVETSDNWHGSQRLSSIKLGTVRALNKYKKKTPSFRKDSVHGGCVIGLKRVDDASTILRKKVYRNRLTRHSREDWVK